MIVRLETPSSRRQQAAADTRSDSGKDRYIVTANSDIVKGVTSTDPNADEGQGATAANIRVLTSLDDAAAPLRTPPHTHDLHTHIPLAPVSIATQHRKKRV